MFRAARITAIGLIAALVSLLALAAPARAVTPYYYAGAVEGSLSGVTGVSAKMRVSNPYVQNNSGEHTLMELALRDDTPDNVAEFGWRKTGVDTGPKLFTYYWVSGNPVNCYNGCAAWHDNTSNPVNIGSDLSSDAAACVGTSLACVKSFQIEYRASTCGSSAAGVFMTYAGTDVGCLDSASLPVTSFTTFQGYGEVHYGGSTVPCTDMGNGKYANSGPYSSLSPAVIKNITYLGTATTPTLSLVATDTNAYTAVSDGSIGNTSFSVGGPGYTSTGTSPGNLGSC